VLRASIRVVASVWLAGAIALAAWFGPSPNPFAPGVVAAGKGTCGNKAHTLTLSNGAASPGTGTTTTSFRFSVRYTDNANCPPTQVSVTIPGVGLFSLTGSSSAYSAGVTFSVSRRLPIGTWTYLFTAQSGSGGGSRLVTLRSVSPTRVVVTATTATPAPRPTAKPTPKATSKPGPRPTPSPTTKPGATPSGGAAATPDESVPPDESEPPTADETGDPSGLGTGDDGSAGGGGGSGLPPVFHGSAEAGFVTWLFTTAGGLLLFAFLMRRQRYQPQPVSSDLASGARDSSDVDPAAGEVRMPRWRRPSVQAARSASRYGETITRPPLKFPGPPASGVERVVVQYRFVRVADSPDNIRSMELGRLDRGDEVDVLERRSGFAHVQAPDGLDGWVPRMTLAQIESPD
jgi:SH3 domain-containing protein